MKRIVSIHLRNWALDRLYRSSDAPAPDAAVLVLTASDTGGQSITAVSAGARDLGIASGDLLADARAVYPDLVSLAADPQADARALERLARWMIRWTPSVAIDGRDGLFLDITGCAHLFGGEKAMLADMSGRLASAGVAHALAVADTPGAAWALARFADTEQTVCAPGQAMRALGSLPVAALRLSPQTVDTLTCFGLVRIADMESISRRALKKRFGSSSVVRRLDQAFGHRPEPLTVIRPPVPERVVLPCPEPLCHSDGVRSGLEVLLTGLCARLKRDGRGARALSFHAFGSDGRVCTVAVRMAWPVSDPDHCGRLFSGRLDQIDAGDGIDCLVLEATQSEKLCETTQMLSPQWSRKVDTATLGRLVDTLGLRTRVHMVTPCASHVPECAETQGAVSDVHLGHNWSETAMSPRPLRLLSPPESVDALAELPDSAPVRFIWRRISYRIVRADGPERISDHWWQADRSGAGRDYYRLEDSEGQRFWLFRTWDKVSAPRWYVHGLFA